MTQRTSCCLDNYEGSDLSSDAFTILKIIVIIFFVTVVNLIVFSIFYDTTFIYTFPVIVMILQVVGFFGLVSKNKCTLKTYYIIGGVVSGFMSLYIFFGIFYMIFKSDEVVEWLFIICFSIIQSSLMGINISKIRELIADKMFEKTNSEPNSTSEVTSINIHQVYHHIDNTKLIMDNPPNSIQPHHEANIENQYYYPPPPSPPSLPSSSYIYFNDSHHNSYGLPIYYQPVIRVPINRDIPPIIYDGNGNSNQLSSGNEQTNNYNFNRMHSVFPYGANQINRNDLNGLPSRHLIPNPYSISPVYYLPQYYQRTDIYNNENRNIIPQMRNDDQITNNNQHVFQSSPEIVAVPGSHVNNNV